MRDIDYFTETRMNKTIGSFSESLPNKLKGAFLKNLGDDHGNVLQGYRGPSNFCNGGSGDSETLRSESGVQEIRVWYDDSKHWNGFPIFGNAAYIRSDWKSYYFDEADGSYLTHDEANQRRRNILDENNNRLLLDIARIMKKWFAENNNDFENAETSFQTARDKFKGAKSLDPENTMHQKYEQIVSFKIEGDRLFNQGVELQEQADEFDQQHFEKAIDKYQEALLQYQQGFEASNFDKRFKSCIDRVKGSIKVATVRNNDLIAQILKEKKEKKVNQAKSLHQEGLKLLDKGWNAEDNNDFENAETSFQTARDKFKEAKSLDPENTMHQKYEQIVSFKIEGDRLFNQGVELQEQADEFDQQHFEKAIDKYQEALLQYQQGFEASNFDKRFKSCIDRVKGSIKVATVRNNDLIAQILKEKKEKKVNQAKSLHQEGLKLLDKGWNAEDNNDFENAETSFQTARDKFKEAKRLDPENTMHQKYEQIVSFKIEGDRLFNQGVELQEQADELDQQHFEKAIDKYQEADEFDQQHFEKAIDKYKEALLKYQQGFEASNYDKRFKLCIDRVQKSTEVATVRNNALIARRLKEKNVNQAKSLDQQGLTLLDKGWIAENNNDFESAETSFLTARDKFKEAKRLDPENTMHQKYEQIVSFKIEGDRLFNQGVELQEQADEFDQQHFEKAIDKYKEALHKYEQGFEASNYDKRFKLCIDRVQKSTEVATVRNNALIARRLKEKNVNQAKSLDQQGLTLLDKGWIAENNNDFESAETSFLTARDKFKEAKRLDPENTMHQKYEQIVSFKIEGDRLFNQGVELQNQADEFDQQHFEKAIDKYKEALHKYEQGFEASNYDKRFKLCVDRVQKSTEVATVRNNELIARRLKEKNVNQAKSLDQQGLTLLDKGWIAENNNDFESAETSFLTARDKFKEAKRLDPENTMHQKYEQIVSFKIEGDRLFNQGVELQNQADEFDQQHFEKAIDKYKEALHKYEQGFEASNYDKRFKLCVDRVQKSTEVATVRNNELIARRLKEKNVNQAKSLDQQGLTLLDKGWIAENNNDFESAETSFLTARDKFKEAKRLDPENTMHQKYEQIVSFKIEGDRLFNQGVELQNQADEFDQQHFEKAIDKYKEALHKYEQGFEASNYDKRFKLCIDRVQKSTEVATVRNNALIARRLKEKNVNQAKSLDQQGLTLLDKGWIAENNNDFESAETSFLTARDKFKEAKRLDPENTMHQKYEQIVSFKIEGDRLFNQGVELQEQADEFDQQHFEKAIDKYKEALHKYEQGFEASNYDKRFKLCIDRVQKSTEVATVRNNALIARRLKEKNVNQAKSLDQQGLTLLDKGWIAENNNDFENAETSFQTARDKFKEAKRLDPENTMHQKYEQIVSFKIEGDRLFNQGVELQEQADEFDQQHFEKAIDKYKEALLKYQQGFEAPGRDERFKSCIDIVQKSIEVATQTTRILQASLEDAINEDTEDNTDDGVEKLSFKCFYLRSLYICREVGWRITPRAPMGDF